MPPNPPRLLNFIITITINRLDMVDSGIESSELSALETAAADELDGMSSEESGRFVERLAAEGTLCHWRCASMTRRSHSDHIVFAIGLLWRT